MKPKKRTSPYVAKLHKIIDTQNRSHTELRTLLLEANVKYKQTKEEKRELEVSIVKLKEDNGKLKAAYGAKKAFLVLISLILAAVLLGSNCKADEYSIDFPSSKDPKVETLFLRNDTKNKEVVVSVPTDVLYKDGKIRKEAIEAIVREHFKELQ